MFVKIGIIGLGYVGMPLAIEFSKIYPVVGYDIYQHRVDELNSGNDSTGEVSKNELLTSTAVFTSDVRELESCDVYIVTVPTPINEAKQPDLSPLIAASQTIGKMLEQNDIVIYESTVYPGATEEVCVPVLEEESGLVFNLDFFVGYSPERINPGDKERGVRDIVKVTSGSTPKIADFVDCLYNHIVDAGTHLASSIKVAEAAKVIENTQRDVNISLMNELAMIFNKLDIDTNEVLAAAGTKWNFLPFKPGLVGGHCISVDPYYLTHKAQSVGYHPDVILSGRRVNDGMGAFIASETVKLMSQSNINVSNSYVLIMGYAFKENCPDTRNTRVKDIVHELEAYNVTVNVIDPWVDIDTISLPNMITETDGAQYDAVIITVGHNAFVTAGIDGIKQHCSFGAPILDIKGIFPAEDTDWRL